MEMSHVKRFADICILNEGMKSLFRITRFKFYVGVGAIWLLIWLISSLLNHPEAFVTYSLNETWRTIYLVIVHFLFIENGLTFIKKKRVFIFYNVLAAIFLISLQLFLISFGLYAWRYLGIHLHVYTILRQSFLSPDGPYHQMMYEVSYQIQGGILSFFFFWFSKLLYDNFKLRESAQQLRIEMQEAELNFLKSQTNPHFLFNTLNNIYSLALDKSDLVPESILRLSKMLRFTLYETQEKFICIKQEIEIINDYIALEKLRYDDSLNILFSLEIEDIKQAIPPLLLIPLVENAFKHGVSETVNHPFVEVQLIVSQQHLTFMVKNSTKIANEARHGKENIGLSNLRRQLELLYREYNLTVQKEETVFTAVLKINLASHV
jgi:sensor histidine kinase YesM